MAVALSARFPSLSSLVLVLLASLAMLGCSNVGNIREVTPDPGAHDGSLTLMSFNIRVGYGRKDPKLNPWKIRQAKKNLPPIIAAIRSVDPDVVGLQEVLRIGQARNLAEALDMNYAYTSHPGIGWWGVAILSKYRILGAESRTISGKRNMLTATIEFAGKTLTIASIHRDKDITKGSSTKNLLSNFEEDQGPVVLIGDFNFVPHDFRWDMVEERFLDTAMAVETDSAYKARARGTWMATPARIDYVFVDPVHFEVQDAGIVDFEHQAASDHIAYYAVVVLKP